MSVKMSYEGMKQKVKELKRENELSTQKIKYAGVRKKVEYYLREKARMPGALHGDEWP